MGKLTAFVELQDKVRQLTFGVIENPTNDHICEAYLACMDAFGVTRPNYRCGYMLTGNVIVCGRRQGYLSTRQFPVWNAPTVGD